MWKSGSIKPQSVSPTLPALRSRFGGAYRLLLSVGILFGTLVFIFPLVFKPGVEPLTENQFGSPFSLAIQISNQNLTPLTDVQYSCEVSKLTAANGSAIGDAKILLHGAARKIGGNHSITAHCETAHIMAAPANAIEYKLTLTYRMYPWPQYRTIVHRIATQIDINGQVVGWKLN
jgi:hypothetical protein